MGNRGDGRPLVLLVLPMRHRTRRLVPKMPRLQTPSTRRLFTRHCSTRWRPCSGPDEPMVDPISPDGKLARIHLRAYTAADGACDALADAFVATAQQPPAGHDKLERFCACLGDFAASGEIALDAASVRAYFGVAAERYPVVHHSTAFRSAYRPAYRIVVSISSSSNARDI